MGVWKLIVAAAPTYNTRKKVKVEREQRHTESWMSDPGSDTGSADFEFSGKFGHNQYGKAWNKKSFFEKYLPSTGNRNSTVKRKRRGSGRKSRLSMLFYKSKSSHSFDKVKNKMANSTTKKPIGVASSNTKIGQVAPLRINLKAPPIIINYKAQSKMNRKPKSRMSVLPAIKNRLHRAGNAVRQRFTSYIVRRNTRNHTEVVLEKEKSTKKSKCCGYVVD